MNRCIECKVNVARYWGNHLCEDCFRKILKENAKIKVKQAACLTHASRAMNHLRVRISGERVRNT